VLSGAAEGVRPSEHRAEVVCRRRGGRLLAGTVLARRKSPTGWHGLVRFSRDMPQGYSLTFEHCLPADLLGSA